MRKYIFGILAIAFVGLFVGVKRSEGLVSDSARSMSTVNDRGDTGLFTTVSVGTSPAVAVFSTNTVSMTQVRDVQICNGDVFDLWVGTFSVVDSSSTNRMYIPQNWCQSVPFGVSLWGIYESAAGGSKKVTTVIWSQSGQ